MLRLILPAMLVSANSLAAQAPPAAPAANPIPAKKWPAQIIKVEIPCSDGAKQPVMWFAPPATEKERKPLLVGLHTWSSHYASAGGDAVYAEWCIAQGWAFVHPHFRGPNNTPEALGSDRAVQDVVESVAWAKQQTAVDTSRIYLVGVSGGGHMAMHMAARHPEIWAGVSAWCGISDVAQWHADHVRNGKPDRYATNIESALGRAPAKDDPEAWKRSPLSSLKAATIVPLDINHGLHDGRKGSVPFTHSLHAFNAVVPGKDRIPEDAIRSFYEAVRLPAGLPAADPDPSYATWKPVFRKVSGNTRATIFEGGHEIVHQAALNWLAQQRKGQPAVWDVKDFIKLDVGGGVSGK
jgi:dipeptidyl aminopeptidase/acylaminoacyl peptidase